MTEEKINSAQNYLINIIKKDSNKITPNLTNSYFNSKDKSYQNEKEKILLSSTLSNIDKISYEEKFNSILDQNDNKFNEFNKNLEGYIKRSYIKDFYSLEKESIYIFNKI